MKKYIKTKAKEKVNPFPMPITAVKEFAKWCEENNDMLNKKGCDVLNCVREWEDHLMLMSKHN
jgi:hypothetical protein